jgi:hypothetical protein
VSEEAITVILFRGVDRKTQPTVGHCALTPFAAVQNKRVAFLRELHHMDDHKARGAVIRPSRNRAGCV